MKRATPLRQKPLARPPRWNPLGRFPAGILFALWFTMAGQAMGQETTPSQLQQVVSDLSSFRIPAGLRVELFADESQLSNSVAICLDESGRLYIAEEHRFDSGTEENRSSPFFLEDDLQIETLEDRLAMYRKYQDRFEGGMAWFAKNSDLVRVLVDRDADGRADVSKVFAGGFNDPLDGLAAGLTARDGDVYLTNIPHLWRLRDTDGDAIADVREKLLSGFGVNAAFLGHDLHGLVWGPDGRLYFSIGDRGFDVLSKEGKRFSLPRRGAVFRCDPDGGNFEVIHIGLRNPQELAFDEFGNLFAADNNADKGDLSRLIYVVDQADSGWNMAYQTMDDPYLTGPWHAENMWRVEASDQPAWIMPPVGALGAGPSGFSYYPGVGLGSEFNGHFFLCNFTAGNRTGVETFSVQPHGASFRLVSGPEFFKPVRASDIAFGYDGKVYVSNYVDDPRERDSRRGRVYSLFAPNYVASQAAHEIRTLFAEGFRDQESDTLLGLLAHADMRVRLRAQYELARRVIEDPHQILTEKLKQLAKGAPGRKSRHALWALWQVARQRPATIDWLRSLQASTDTTSHSDKLKQLLRILGDLRDIGSRSHFAELLQHDSPRIQFLAALALGRLAPDHDKQIVDSIGRLIIANNDADAYLRHAAVNALDRHADEAALVPLANDPSRSVRLAALLVCRRRAVSSEPCRNLLVQFLHDEDVGIATEAVRAINGLALGGSAEAAFSAVTDHWQQWERIPEALARRVIYANFRTGHAERLLECAVSMRLTSAMRREALECLALWATGTKRDRVNGNWRPISGRSKLALRLMLERGWKDRLLEEADGALLNNVIALLAEYDVPVERDLLTDWAVDSTKSHETRIACLQLLSQENHEAVHSMVVQFLGADEPEIRIAGLEVAVQLRPDSRAELLQAAIERPDRTTRDLQAICRLLGKTHTAATDRLLERLLKQVSTDAPDPVVAGAELEIVAAARRRDKQRSVARQLQKYRAKIDTLSQHDPLAGYRAAMTGGDETRGESLFRTHRLGQCIRCHKADGVGGTAGPDLSDVATRADRRYLLESIIDANASIAKGFEKATIVTTSGLVRSGVVQSEDEQGLKLKTPEGRIERIEHVAIEDRFAARSAMPEFKSVLPLEDIRDLVAFLATQRSPVEKQ